ncbi:MAG TPA: hypothetical protein VLZ78_10010 [Terrimesophilobacter sp.]|nr:hypothetical protein [Terrimesophilobacter sp.]
MAEEFAVRPATPADLPLIYSSCARSFHGSPYYRDVAGPAWTATVNRLVGERLEDPRWLALVAHPLGMEDEIAGWLLARPDLPAVLGPYVKHSYRLLGVARMLAQKAGVTPGEAVAVVLASPSLLASARAKGYRPHLSPYVI